VIDAAATVLCTAPAQPPNVTTLTELAGVGRNTFYSFFRDARDVQRATEEAATRQLAAALDRQLDRAVTPIEKLRALAHAWVTLANSDRALLKLALRNPADNPNWRPETPLLRHLAVILQAARASGVTALAVSERRLVMVVAAWRRALRDGVGPEAMPLVPELVDFTLRAFR
jgi:AcrR family transcriptional regulator